jgi:hypothetical protein
MMKVWERQTKSLVILAALAVGIGAAACGDDGGGDDLVGANSAQIEANRIVFSDVPIDGEATETVNIYNNGAGPLRITKIELKEESGGSYDGEREFVRGDIGWDKSSITIAPETFHTIAVKYTPKNTTRDVGELLVTSNDSNYPNGFKIPISTSDLAPDLYSNPTVSFGRVPHRPDEPDWEGEFELTQVQNLGAAALKIEDIYVSGSDRFRVTFPQPTEQEVADGHPPAVENDISEWPETVAPDGSFPVRVWFSPDDNLPETAELVFESNDVDESQYVVNLNGNSGAACLQVSPGDEINFSQSSLGQTSQKTITLENCSRSSELKVSDIQLTDDGGGVYAIQESSLPGSLPTEEAVIPAGERANFVVTFEPTAEESYEGELTIVSDDTANSPKKIPVLGRGSDNACPTAKARGWVQGSNRPETTIETIPLNTIMFDGSDSSDPNGSVADYEWTILSRPQGSTQRLLPNSTSVNPRLFLDLAGTYEVELKVKDDEGAYSCGTAAIITIIAVPKDDLHIQLVWDTPSDPDQTDTFGTDLDLHYLHPNGRWDDQPWDIFWRNPGANWGDPASSSDDPHLDIDDTDGAGPENINHSELENLKYRAGVYYYSDNTLGASYATLRIYVRGALALEIENKYMPRTGSFWDAAIIEWPSANVTNISRMYQGFPGSP